MERSVIDDLIAELEQVVDNLRGSAGNDAVIAELQTQIDSLRQRYTEK